MAPARVEHGPAHRHLDAPSAGIGDGDEAAPTLRRPAHRASEQRRAKQERIGSVERVLDHPARVAHEGIVEMRRLDDRLAPFRMLLLLDEHFASALPDPEQRQGRQQHRAGQQHRGDAAIAGLDPQPEMHAEAAMRPGGEQHHDLLPGGDRAEHEEDRQDRGLAALHAER